MKNVLLCLLSLCFITLASAAEIKNCLPAVFTVQNNNVILQGVDTSHPEQIYLFKNNSTQSLWLDHPVTHASASAGWSSYLQPGRASVLLVNRKNFVITCAVIQPGKVVYLNCAHAVSICSLATVSSKVHKGTYWLVENKTPDEITKSLQKRGVLLSP